MYGRVSLGDIEAAVREQARGLGVECSWTQTNHEGELVEAASGKRFQNINPFSSSMARGRFSLVTFE